MTSATHIIPLLESIANACSLAFELRHDHRVTRISPPVSSRAMPLSQDLLAQYLGREKPFCCTAGSPQQLVWGIPFTGCTDGPSWLLAHTRADRTMINNDGIMPMLSQLLKVADANHQLVNEIEEMATALDQSFEELALFGRIEEVDNPKQFSSKQLPALCAGLRQCMDADLVFVRIPDCPDMRVTVGDKKITHNVGGTEAFIDALLALSSTGMTSGDLHFCLNDSRQDKAFDRLSNAPFRYLAACSTFNNKLYGWIGIVSFDFKNFFKRSHMRLLINTAVQLALLAANNDLLRGLDLLTSRVEQSKRHLDADLQHADPSDHQMGHRALGFLNNAFSQMSQSIEASQTLLAQNAQMATVGQLASVFAHEIKQPLTALCGLVHIAQRESGASSGRNNLDMIAKIANRMIKMVKRFGSFSKPIEHTLKSICLNEATQEAFELIAPQLKLNDIQGELDLDASLPRVMADALGLQQVVLNLVTNAVQAMASDDDGQNLLRLRTYYDATHAFLDVEDTGHGIDQADSSHIFDPYYSTKTPNQGTGLGLFVARDIMEQFSGGIEVDSLSGKGSRFTLKIPMAIKS